MDSTEIGVLLGGLSLIAATLWFFFGEQKEKKPDAVEGQPLCDCPMHPWITSSDATANCSVCGMKLVKPV